MGKPFKMKGHTLPGINQRSEGNTDLPDGRSASAALQYKSPLYNTESKAKNMTKIDKKDLGNYQKPAEGYEWVMLDGKPSQVKTPATYVSPAKQTEEKKEQKRTDYTPPPAGSQEEKAQHTREASSVGRRYSKGLGEVRRSRRARGDEYGKPNKK